LQHTPGIHRLGCTLLAVLALSTAADARTRPIPGADFAPVIRAGETRLVLNGVGLYRRYLWKVYVGALYLQEGIGPDEVHKDVSKRIELHYLRDIPAQTIAKHTSQGITANQSPEELARIGKDMERLAGLFVDVKAGDQYAVTYVDGKGLYLERNGQNTAFFENPEFARALFSVWLGDVPLDESFKRSVLTPSKRTSTPPVH